MCRCVQLISIDPWNFLACSVTIKLNMTLILSLGNQDQVVQISDRRLSLNGQLVDDESNKAGLLLCANARLAFGFAGLARIDGFETKDWLSKSIFECCPPDFSAQGIIERLKEKATHDIHTLPALKKLRQVDKRLSILFSGYLAHIEPPVCVSATMTNYQNFETGQDSLIARKEFKTLYSTEKRPHRIPGVPTFIQKVGAWQYMTEEDLKTLRKMLSERSPAKMILEKAVSIIRAIADRPNSGGIIGKQLSALIIPRNMSQVPEATYHSYTYHSNTDSYEEYLPDQIFGVSPEEHAKLTNVKIKLSNSAPQQEQET